MCDQMSYHIEPDYTFKIILIGDSGVGKSSILFRYTDDKFRPTIVNTIGIDFRTKTVIVDGKIVKLQLWDTAGQERFNSIAKYYYKHTDAVIFVYDLTSLQSFKNMETWAKYITVDTSLGIEKIILGNKSDLDRAVPFELVKNFADDLDILVTDVSAKYSIGINDAIESLCLRLIKKCPNKENSSDNIVKIESKNSFSGTKCCGV